MRMLAEATGGQKGSVVYHFQSKDKIRSEVLDSVLDHWKEILPELMLASTRGENRFETTLDTLLQFFIEDPNRARLLVRECFDNPEEMKQRIAEQLLPWISAITDSIEAGQELGYVREEINPLAYAWQISLMSLATISTFELIPETTFVGSEESTKRILRKQLIRIAKTSLYYDHIPKKQEVTELNT